MKKEQLITLHTSFENQMRVEESGCEFWYARELQELLGYSQWRSFEQVVEKAILACHNSGYEPGDHFARVRKMVEIGSGAERAIDDIALSRFACYLVAQNGDSNKEQIAFAQTYFAVQTRKMEVIEQRLGENQSFARIRSKADSALFGGLSCTIRFSTTDKANYLHGF